MKTLSELQREVRSKRRENKLAEEQKENEIVEGTVNIIVGLLYIVVRVF